MLKLIPSFVLLLAVATTTSAQPFQIEKLYEVETQVGPDRQMSLILPVTPGVDGDTIYSYALTADLAITEGFSSLIKFDPSPIIVLEQSLNDPMVGRAPQVAENGVVVFGYGASSGSGGASLYRWDGVSDTPLLLTGTSRPGGGTYNVLRPEEMHNGAVLVSDRIQIGFEFIIDGYFVVDGETGSSRRVIAVGDMLDGETVDQIGVGGLGDNGSVAFYAVTATRTLFAEADHLGQVSVLLETGDQIPGGSIVSFAGRPVLLPEGTLFTSRVEDGTRALVSSVYLLEPGGPVLLIPNTLYFEAARSSSGTVIAEISNSTGFSVALIELSGSTHTIVDTQSVLDGRDVVSLSLDADSIDATTAVFIAQHEDPMFGFQSTVYRVDLAPCPADLTTVNAPPGDPDHGVPDGQVTAIDLQFYVNAFVAQDVSIADMTTTNAPVGDPDYGVPDGAVTAADIQFYVNLWIAGCP